MLGLTSYQEALRALGAMVEPTDHVRIVEQPADGRVAMVSRQGSRLLGGAALEDLVVSDRARRGQHGPAGGLSDVLRAVGRALDELRARETCLELEPGALRVRFRDAHHQPHELAYVGDELEALQRAAAARRNGQSLRRVLILHAAPDSAAGLVEVLVAEFAVQALPTLYARAVAAAAEPPDLVLAQAGADPRPTLSAVQTLRHGQRTAAVPIVVLLPAEATVDPATAFEAGADDLLTEPVLPAQLRARVRTSLLRGRVDR